MKDRKRYSQKLARQLQNIGVDVDIVSGVENKLLDPEETLSIEECVKKDKAVVGFDAPEKGSGSNTINKGLLESIADETLHALESR